MKSFRIFYTDSTGEPHKRVLEFSSYAAAEAWLKAIGARAWTVEWA